MSKAHWELFWLKPDSQRVWVEEARWLQIDTLNSLTICIIVSSPSGNVIMTWGTQLIRDFKQARSFSNDPSKDTIAISWFLKIGSFTKIECDE